MWKERLSGYSTPSTLPPSRPRSQSPAPRAGSHLAPWDASRRPNLSPRSSSLSLISSAAPQPSAEERGTKESSRFGSSGKGPDPLETLEGILYTAECGPRTSRKDVIDSETGVGPVIFSSDAEVIGSIDFRGQSLRAFTEAVVEEGPLLKDERFSSPEGSAEYEREKDHFEDLRSSIAGCDNVLCSVEQYLSSFQTDLATVSAEIEKLQTRSTALNQRLRNRQAVEDLLAPAVDQVSIPPALVRKICEDAVDGEWVLALAELERRSEAVERSSQSDRQPRALADVKPILSDLTDKAVERVRDHLVAQVKSLRSPNVNAQIIQQKSFLSVKDLYGFLARRHAKLSEEIGQAYIYTMRWYYLNHFTRYSHALERLKLHILDKHDVLGQSDLSRKATSARESAASYDAFNLGTRTALLRPPSPAALTSYLAEESSSTHCLEVPFYHFNLALIDNATTEYSFLMEFFSPHSFHIVSRKFAQIFEPTFQLGRRLSRQLIEGNFDCLGVLLCVRLNQSFAFELQRRKVPSLDSYVNGTNMLLWPRFQIIIDAHCESIRKATGALSGRATTALSLMGGDSSKQSTAPHPLTQKLGQLMQGILALSGEAGDDEPVSSSLRRLRTDFDAFLTKFSKSISDARKRQRCLFNNYSLVVTIISDTSGKLADEQKAHFEKLKGESTSS